MNGILILNYIYILDLHFYFIRGVIMEKNVGKIDRIIRLILAVLFVYAGYTMSGWYQILYLFAITLIITVFTGFCLPYKWFGINTLKKSSKRK